MAVQNATLDEVLELAERLPLIDKVRLIERLAPRIASEVDPDNDVPRRSLRGLWKGIDVSIDDLTEIRQKIWASLPGAAVGACVNNP